MKKSIIISVSLVAMALLSGPLFTSDVNGSGVAHGKGVFRGDGAASGTGVVVYRDNNGNVRYKKGTGTVSGRGIANGRGAVADRGKGYGKGRAKGRGKAGRF